MARQPFSGKFGSHAAPEAYHGAEKWTTVAASSRIGTMPQARRRRSEGLVLAQARPTAHRDVVADERAEHCRNELQQQQAHGEFR
jgi:hypothetical protein